MEEREREREEAGESERMRAREEGERGESRVISECGRDSINQVKVANISGEIQ